MGNAHLPALHVVFVAVHNGPGGLIAERPPGRKDAVHVHGIKRFPVRAEEEWSDSSLDRGHSTGSFGVTRRDAIPDAPDVLPALPSLAVKERELKIVGLGAVPPVAHMDHV